MFKIGDRIRYIGSGSELDISKDRIYTVDTVYDDEFTFPDDAGDMRWRQQNDPDFELVRSDEELAALREWKASALARFPALEEPETDEEAAERFARDLGDEGLGEGVNDILLTAFAWARANPR